jgi:hypothetical protein
VPGAKQIGRIAAWLLGAVLVVAVLATAWIAVRGALAYGHLRTAQSTAATIASDLSDPSRAATAVEAITADTSAARELTGDPIWTLAEGLPWVGPQLAAVGAVAATVDDIAGTALAPLAEVASSFSVEAIRPQDGAIDVEVFRALQPAAQAGAEGVARASASLDEIDTGPLLAPLRTAVTDVRDLVRGAGVGVDALARASALLPPMLGGDGERTYLVVFQNNAEWRSLGGIVGAMAEVRTEGGRMSLTAQGSSSDFQRYDDVVVPLSDELLQVYGRRPALFVQNATQAPDFPTAAEIAREMWLRETGVEVDGVISLDPVALSYLLEATGPLRLPTGDELTAENAVDLLLNGVYQRHEHPADQDLFFAAAAATVFDALAAGVGDPVSLLEGLSRAGSEDRLLLWNADPAEQAVLDGTTLQGGLPVTDAEQTNFGVYLNDGTGAKMDYYMTPGVSVGWCTGSGGPEAGLVVTLRNDAPADAATLPDYITGGAAFGVAAGSVRTLAYVYLPEGAELISATPSGGDSAEGIGGGIDRGRRVVSWTTDLAPGEEASLTVRAQTPVTPVIDARETPSVYTIETRQLAETCEVPR